MSNDDDSDFDEPEPSVLGTKQLYVIISINFGFFFIFHVFFLLSWDKHYEKELQCLNEAESTQQKVDIGGECWFDDRIVNAVLKYCRENIDPKEKKTFIDIGCGGGALLRRLV